MQTLSLSPPQMSLLTAGPAAPAQAKTLARAQATEQANAQASVKSTELLKGSKTLAIEHNGAVYRLQTTKLGKLILTK